MTTINKFSCIQSKLLRDISDFLNLGQFDPINRMILLTVIPLSGACCMLVIEKYLFLIFDFYYTRLSDQGFQSFYLASQPTVALSWPCFCGNQILIKKLSSSSSQDFGGWQMPFGKLRLMVKLRYKNRKIKRSKLKQW